jgi:hypothetical protein
MVERELIRVREHALKLTDSRTEGNEGASRHVPLLQGTSESRIGEVDKVKNSNLSFTLKLKSIVRDDQLSLSIVHFDVFVRLCCVDGGWRRHFLTFGRWPRDHIVVGIGASHFGRH